MKTLVVLASILGILFVTGCDPDTGVSVNLKPGCNGTVRIPSGNVNGGQFMHYGK